jgi:hypothetical protein
MLEPTVDGASPSRRRPGSGTRLDALGSAAGAIIRIAVVAIGAGLLFALFKPLVVALPGALFVALALKPVVDVLVRRGMRPGTAATVGMLHEFDVGVDKLDAALAPTGVDGGVAEVARRSIAGHLPALVSGILPTVGTIVGRSPPSSSACSPF